MRAQPPSPLPQNVERLVDWVSSYRPQKQVSGTSWGECAGCVRGALQKGLARAGGQGGRGGRAAGQGSGKHRRGEANRLYPKRTQYFVFTAKFYVRTRRVSTYVSICVPHIVQYRHTPYICEVI